MADVAQTFIDKSAAREQQALSRQQRLAEILQQQAFQPDQKFSYAGVEAPPSGAAALAKGLQGGIAGYLQGRALKGQDDLVKKTEAREERYGTDLAKVLAAGTEMREAPRPAADSVGPMPGKMGGYEGIAAALQGINNPDVTRALGPQMAMAQIAQQQAATDRARQLEDQKAIRLAPTYQPPVAGRDIPLSPEVFGQQVTIAGAKATATAQPPSGYQANSQGGLTPTPGGPADPNAAPKPRLPPGEVEKITAIDNSYGSQTKLMETYQDEFGGYGAAWAGDLKSFLAARTNSPEGQKQAQWWAAHYANDSVARNILFGAALTPTEAASWERTTINPGMESGMIRGRMKERADLIAAKRGATLENFSGAGYDTKDLKMKPSSYLSGEDRIAYDWAKKEIKKNPNNAAAKTLIEMYNK